MLMNIRKSYVLCILCLLFACKVQAFTQEILQKKVTINVKDFPLVNALKKLKEKTGVEFAYSNESVKPEYRITLKYRNRPLFEILDHIAHSFNLNYSLVGGYISIYQASDPVQRQASPSPVRSGTVDQILVKGIVTNKSREPLIGASIKIKGSMTGTTTDAYGRYSITANEYDTLVFSHVGFRTQEVAIRKRETIDISLNDEATALNEVVVIGYGTQKKSDVTGSLAGINSEELNRNKNSDVLSALQGKLSGVNISSQSGELGAGLNITVRGGNSIYGSSQPLFVIDGIPIDINPNEVAGSSIAGSSTTNPLMNLNPADIESVEVLKDASATAIYGSRGANGVVLVTTKSGKAGEPRIDYTGYVSVGQLSKKLKVLSAPEFIQYEKLVDPNGTLVSIDTTGDGVGDVPIDFTHVPTHDWQDEAFRTSVSHSHNLTISGGNKVTTFSGSMGYLYDQGLIHSNTNNRYTLRLKLDHQATDRLRIGFNLDNSRSELNGSTASGANFYKSGVIGNIVYGKPIEVYDPTQDVESSYVSLAQLINNAYKNTTLLNLIGNVNLSYKITPGLSFSMITGGTVSSSKGNEFYGNNTIQGYQLGGDAFINNINSYSLTHTDQLSYNKKFNQDHSLSLMGAFEVSNYNFESNGMEGQKFADQSTGPFNISKAGLLAGYTNYRYQNNRLSYITRANYNLKNKYLFTASFRADGSDKFGSNNKWGLFPSGAFAWRVSNEKFMQHQHLLQNLKARLSYGVTGNERIPPYSYLGTQEITYYSSNGIAQIGSSPDNKENPDLKWEKTIQYNAGLDFSLLAGRLDVTADYYYKTTTNMLLPAPISAYMGHPTQWQNIGRIDNKGLELSLVSHNMKKNQFSWETNFNISYNENVIKSLGQASMIPVTINGEIKNIGAVIVGQPLGTGYGYVFDGVYQLSDFTWQNNSDPSIDPSLRSYVIKPGVLQVAGATVLPGSFKFRDLNGDGVVNDKDQTVISHSAPKYIFGLTNTFRYGSWDFSFFLQGVQGSEIINQSLYTLDGFQTKANILEDFYLNRWTVDNPSNKYGTFARSNATAGLSSSYYVEDGSYLRVKNITLGWTLPARSLNRLHMKQVRLYVAANNVFTLTNYSGYDPEVNWKDPLLTGVDKLAFPRTRTVIFGTNISF